MKKAFLLLILLAGSTYSFSQPERPAGLPLTILLLTDSIKGTMMEVHRNMAREIMGKLLVEADPNDIRKDVYDKQLLIEVIHARAHISPDDHPLGWPQSF